MPEITGVVTAKSDYGLKLDDNEDWWNWSKIEYRSEPFNVNVKKGDVVRVVYAESDTGKIYISVIDRVTQARDVTPTTSGGVPFDDDFPTGEDLGNPPQTPPLARQPVVSGKDALMAKMNAIKVAGELYAACIEAGLYKKLPTPDEISAYATAIEARLD